MNILLAIVDEDEFRQAPERAMLAAAVRVRRAGLEHLVTGQVTPLMLASMEIAGEQLRAEQALLLAEAIHNPANVQAFFDGGDTQRQAFLKDLLRGLKA